MANQSLLGGKVPLSMRLADQETGAELEDTRPPREPREDRGPRGEAYVDEDIPLALADVTPSPMVVGAPAAPLQISHPSTGTSGANGN